MFFSYHTNEMESSSKLRVSVLCPAYDQKRIQSVFFTKTQNRKQTGRKAEAVDGLRVWVSEMSRSHHLGRFTLGFLAAEAKEGYSLN